MAKPLQTEVVPLFGRLSCGFESRSCCQLLNKNIMEKYYITSDKIGEFVARMYAAGIAVTTYPRSTRLVITKPEGGYEWVQVFDKSSFDALCNAFLPPTSEPNSKE